MFVRYEPFKLLRLSEKERVGPFKTEKKTWWYIAALIGQLIFSKYKSYRWAIKGVKKVHYISPFLCDA